MKQWQKKKQLKLANERALEEQENVRKAQEAAAKEEKRKAAILAMQAEQAKMVREMANTAAIVASQMEIPEDSILAKAGTLPNENPEDYLAEEPTGLFGKISKWKREHSKGLKRTAAVIGTAIVLMGILKGCPSGCVQEDPNHSTSSSSTSSENGQQPGQGTKDPEYLPVFPGQGENQPGQGENQPGQGENQPGQGENQPGQGENQPGQGENQPGQGENQPGQGENQPGQGENQPSHECNYETLKDIIIKDNSDGSHTVSEVYQCECGKTHTVDRIEDCDYQLYDNNSERENYKCSDCGNEISRDHQFNSLLNREVKSNENGTHTVSSTYGCECGNECVIDELEDCVYQIYNYDANKEYLKCGECSHLTTGKHQMDNGVINNKTGMKTYSCEHDGCDYSYDRRINGNSSSSSSTPSNPGTPSNPTNPGTENPENNGPAAGTVDEENRNQDNPGDKDLTDTGSGDEVDETRDTEGDEITLDGTPTEGENPEVGASIENENLEVDTPVQEITENPTNENGSDDLTEILSPSWDEALKDSGFTESAEGVVEEETGRDEGEEITMADIMYDYYTGGYGFDDNDLGNDNGFARSLKL